MSDEIMKDGNVSITRTLAVVQNISYPINTISALYIRENAKSIAWLVLSLIIGLVSLVWLISDPSFWQLLGVAMIALLIYVRPKPTFSLFVRSAGSDTSILVNEKVEYLNQVKAAIEEAVRRRG